MDGGSTTLKVRGLGSRAWTARLDPVIELAVQPGTPHTPEVQSSWLTSLIPRDLTRLTGEPRT